MRTIYTDGACSGNPGPGGWALLEIDEQKNTLAYFSEGREDNTTNNRMEMKAMIGALSYIKEEAEEHPNDEFEIYSDSAYVVNMCNDWIWKWAANGWTRARNKSIENLDLVIELYDLLNFSTIKFKIKKCDGHAGVLGNELVDAFAARNQSKLDRLIKTYNLS